MAANRVDQLQDDDLPFLRENCCGQRPTRSLCVSAVEVESVGIDPNRSRASISSLSIQANAKEQQARLDGLPVRRNPLAETTKKLLM